MSLSSQKTIFHFLSKGCAFGGGKMREKKREKPEEDIDINLILLLLLREKG